MHRVRHDRFVSHFNRPAGRERGQPCQRGLGEPAPAPCRPHDVGDRSELLAAVRFHPPARRVPPQLAAPAAPARARRRGVEPGLLRMRDRGVAAVPDDVHELRVGHGLGEERHDETVLRVLLREPPAAVQPGEQHCRVEAPEHRGAAALGPRAVVHAAGRRLGQPGLEVVGDLGHPAQAAAQLRDHVRRHTGLRLRLSGGSLD